jgi:hypothetical protein
VELKLTTLQGNREREMNCYFECEYDSSLEPAWELDDEDVTFT